MRYEIQNQDSDRMEEHMTSSESTESFDPRFISSNVSFSTASEDIGMENTQASVYHNFFSDKIDPDLPTIDDALNLITTTNPSCEYVSNLAQVQHEMEQTFRNGPYFYETDHKSPQHTVVR